MPSFQDVFFPSSNGKSTIHVRKCLPDGEPRAVIQIVHGIAEHINRYDDFMMFLANNGFAVAGTDHLGHGQSAPSPEELGFFDDEDGWNRVVDDVGTLREMMHEEFHDVPYIFFGHSMGSFLTRTYLINNPDKYDAAIISGTGHQSKALVFAGLAASSAVVKLQGSRADGKMLNDIAFGAYNKKINFPMTEFDWLSRDHESVKKYIDDPMCGFVCKASLYRDMMTGVKYITDQRNIDRMSKDQPIYFMSGACDPVGDYGKGVERAYKAFCDAGLRDVTMHLYPGGRHEMLNETNRQEVYQDILTWLNIKMEKL